MTRDELHAGQREAHAVTRTAYTGSGFSGDGKKFLVTASGTAYVRREDGSLKHRGVLVTRGGKPLVMNVGRVQGKAAVKAAKRARQRERDRLERERVDLAARVARAKKYAKVTS